MAGQLDARPELPAFVQLLLDQLLGIAGELVSLGHRAAGFIATERRVASPILDLRLFRSRSFSAATLSATANYVSVAAVYVLMPFYLIPGRGLSATTTGLV